ncbi:hypothetical protein [Nitrobacter sp.]|uniref:hypothetical protein n=1 Tax=Nitrobacter sp. TaxID=29420 RepID=UPI003F65269A
MKAGLPKMIVAAGRLFDHQTREKWLDDVGAGYPPFFRSAKGDELIPAIETSPKLLKLVRIKTLLPLEMDQA